MSGHVWQDDALRPTIAGGRGWVAAARFTCLRCRVERRMIAADRGSDARTSIYLVGGLRIYKLPQCVEDGDGRT
jgi:hypothetical protein